MLASEYIEVLQDLVKRHGDLMCVDSQSKAWHSAPEFMEEDDAGPACFVVAEVG